MRVRFRDEGLAHETAADAGLIGDDHDRPTRAIQQAHRIDREREQREPLEPIQIARLFDEGAIAIEKDCGPHAGRGRWRATLATTASTVMPFMHLWSIGQSRSMHGRQNTGCTSTS